MSFSMPSLVFILGRLTIRIKLLLLFSKTVLPSLSPAWSNSFVCVSLLQPIYLAESLLTFNLFLRRMILLLSLSLKRKIMRHLSAHNLLFDYQFGFQKSWSTGDILAFITESWLSSLLKRCYVSLGATAGLTLAS